MIPKRSDESAFTLRCRKWKMGMGRHLLRYQFCCGDKKEAAFWVGGRPFIFELSPYLTRKQCEQCTSHQPLSHCPQSVQCNAVLYDTCVQMFESDESCFFFFLCPWFSICFQSVSVKKSQGVLWLFLVLFCYRGGKQPAICMVISQFDRYLRNKENSGMKKLCEFNKWSQIEILSLMFK